MRGQSVVFCIFANKFCFQEALIQNALLFSKFALTEVILSVINEVLPLMLVLKTCVCIMCMLTIIWKANDPSVTLKRGDVSS